MRFTARPRMGGRRAVGRRCRGGPRRDRPLKGSRPRPPPEGRAVTRLGSLGRAGGYWVGRRILALSLVPGQGGFCDIDRSFKGGGELEVVDRLLDDDEGLETVTRFLGGEFEPERCASQLGRRPRMCGVVKCLVMLLMLRWVRLVMPSSGVCVVHPFGLGKVWVTDPPRRMSTAFGWSSSSSSSVGMVLQTAACVMVARAMMWWLTVSPVS